MPTHFLDPYRPGDSLVHRLDARWKLIGTLGFVLLASLVPVGAWPAYVLLFSMTLSVTILAEIGIGRLLRRSALALPFVLAAFTLIFTTPGTAWFEVSIGPGTLGPWTLGPWMLTASVPGLLRFLSIALKAWLSVQAAIVLGATTTFPDLLVAMRALRIPRLLVAIFGLMWRYLFVLADEALRLMQAREARSASPDGRGGGTLVWRGRVTGGMAGNLFLRSLERGERIYAAMAARGYDGEVRTLTDASAETLIDTDRE